MTHTEDLMPQESATAMARERAAVASDLTSYFTSVMQKIRFITLRFEIQFLDGGVLPSFKGSMIRGAIGRAFRRTLCVCEQGGGSVCPYHTIFETRAADEAFTFLRRVDQLPHPYLLEVPITDQRLYRKGECMQFAIRLFGFATDFAMNLIPVILEAGREGFTKQRIPFRIAHVWSESADGTFTLVYDGETMQYYSFPIAGWWKQPDGGVAPSAVRLHFVTPATFVRRGTLQSDITFSDIVTSLVRRTVALAHYAQGIPGVPAAYQGQRLNITNVSLGERSLQWVDMTRYSNHQKTEMLFGGIVGQATFTGTIAPWIPLLQFGMLTHVGKRTTFGFGQYTVKPIM